MNKYHFSKLIFLTIALLTSSVHTLAQEESVQLSNQDRPPRLIKRVSPAYPARAKRDEEAIISISFIVDENGEVQNPIVEEVFGSDDFVATTLRALSRYKFEPAIENGEAVSRMISRMPFRFSQGSAAFGASRIFKNTYTEIMTLLASEEADKEGIYSLMLDLEHSKVNNLYEIAWYAWMKSNYLNIFEPENQEEQIISLSRAMITRDVDGADSIYLSTGPYIRASRALFTLYLKKNEFGGAMATYENFINIEELKESSLYEGTFAFLTPLYERIIEKIESNETFFETGNLSSYGYWNRKLLRPSFSIEAVNGTLKTIDFRCSERSAMFDFVEDQVWTTPESWGVCELYLLGEEGTTFEFYSIPEVAVQ